MTSADPAYLVRLHNFLTTYLNDEELRDLCFYLRINYQDLGGEGRTARARELVLYCDRHGVLPMLVQRCCELRPHASAEISKLAVSSAANRANNTAPGIKQPVLVAQPINDDSIKSFPDNSVPSAIPRMPRQPLRLLVGLIVAIVALVFVWRMLLIPRSSEVPPVVPNTTQTKATELADSLQSFSGTWQVSEQSANGSSLEHWKVTVNKGQITVEAFQDAVPGAPLPSDYHEQLILSDVQIDDQTLHFTAKRSASVTITYTLRLLAADRIEGSYTSTDTTLSDTGMIQGNAGIIHDAGQVIMVRKSAT